MPHPFDANAYLSQRLGKGDLELLDYDDLVAVRAEAEVIIAKIDSQLDTLPNPIPDERLKPAQSKQAHMQRIMRFADELLPAKKQAMIAWNKAFCDVAEREIEDDDEWDSLSDFADRAASYLGEEEGDPAWEAAFVMRARQELDTANYKEIAALADFTTQHS